MHMVRKTLPFLVVAITIFFPPIATASVMSEYLDSLRCGNHLVQIGEAKSEVLRQCGLPDASDAYLDVSGTLEKWTYNFGVNDFIYVFSFYNGELKLIRQTDRGF